MSLKCQFCGKDLIYDRKVCHSCEEKAISSGLHSQDDKDHRWRCDNFLGHNTLPFGSNLGKFNQSRLKMIECPECGEEFSYGRHICHICNGNLLPFGKIFNSVQKTYTWNCNTAIACLDILTSDIGTVETVVKESPHREKLEKTEYKWNEISAINYNDIDIDRKKGLLVYE